MKYAYAFATVAAMIAGPALAQQGFGAHFFTAWDLNSDGEVLVEEATEQRGNVFATFDENSDGILTAVEYVAFDEHRAEDAAAQGAGKGQGGAGRAQIGMTLGFNDTDNDGQVTLVEFLSHTADWLALIDRDGDGKVTGSDFGPQSN